MKGLIITGGSSGGVASSLWYSVYGMAVLHHPAGGDGATEYYTYFSMLTTYAPTATDLSSFKTMMGANAGYIKAIPYYVPGSWRLDGLSISNSNISFGVEPYLYSGSTIRFEEGSPEFERDCQLFRIFRENSWRIL